MAILAISRQMGSISQDLVRKIADVLGYKFIDRKMIRARMERNGFPAEKFNKYDEIKPSFFSFFSKDRENYVHYLTEAIYNECQDNDMKCVFAGRGAFHVLKNLPSSISVRIVADARTRIERAENEFSIDGASAKMKLLRSEMNKFNYYKIYFKLNITDETNFDHVIDTTNMDENEIISAITSFVKSDVSESDEIASKIKIDDLILGQIIVNLLFNAYDINVSNLKVSVMGRKITISGITDTSGNIEYVKKILSCELPNFEIESNISAVQDTMSRTVR